MQFNPDPNKQAQEIYLSNKSNNENSLPVTFNPFMTETERLSVNLPRDALERIYKSFIRPHLDYGDIIYDKPHYESFQNKIENIQYKACIAITGDVQGTSRECV